MILNSWKNRDHNIEEIDTSQERYVRIEIGISLGLVREKISTSLRKHYCKTGGIKNTQNSFKKLLWFRGSTGDYMLKNGLKDPQIYDFFIYAKGVDENLKITDKLSDLNEQQLRALRIYIMSMTSKTIFIETGGMYSTILRLTYTILKPFIEARGECIEVAYPHFEATDELGLYVSDNPKIIKLGKMRIREKDS